MEAAGTRDPKGPDSPGAGVTEKSPRKVSVQIIKRPTMLGIFLSFSMILIGVWLVLNSALRIIVQDEGELNKLIKYRLETWIGGENEDDKRQKKKVEDLQGKFQKSLEKVYEEFAPEQLIRESDRFHLFRGYKVHHVIAIICGGISIIIGLLAASANYLTWCRAWSRVRSYNPKQRVAYRPNLASAMIGWWTLVFGMGLTIPSIMALQRLYEYKGRRWLDGLLNMGTMVHLAEHYQSMLILGITLMLAGVISVIMHWMAFRRTMRVVEKVVSADISQAVVIEGKSIPAEEAMDEQPLLPWAKDEGVIIADSQADENPSVPEEDRW